jgi:hypothetical protein
VAARLGLLFLAAEKCQSVDDALYLCTPTGTALLPSRMFG